MTCDLDSEVICENALVQLFKKPNALKERPLYWRKMHNKYQYSLKY